MNNAVNYPPRPYTLKQLKADPRIESIAYCDIDRCYIVELTDDWKEDGFCRGFTAPTVKATIATLLGCTPADPNYNYDLGCTHEEARLDEEIAAVTDETEWTVDMAKRFLRKNGLPERRITGQTEEDYKREASGAKGHWYTSEIGGARERYFKKEIAAWTALAAAAAPPVYSSPSHASAAAEEAAGEELSVDRLICSNPNCVSHEHAEGARFQVTVEVDAYGGLLTDLDDVESYHFSCCDCGDEATTKRAQGPVAEHAEESATEESSIERAKRAEKELNEHFAGKRELGLKEVEQMMEEAWERASGTEDPEEAQEWEHVEDLCSRVFWEVGTSNAEMAVDQSS